MCKFRILCSGGKATNIGDRCFLDLVIRCIFFNQPCILHRLQANVIFKESQPRILQFIAIKSILFGSTGGADASLEHTDSGYFFAFVFRGIPQSGTGNSQCASSLHIAISCKRRHSQAERKYNSHQNRGCFFNVFHFFVLSVFYSYQCVFVHPYLFYDCASSLPLRLRGTESASSRIPTPMITNIQSPVLPVSGRRG